MSKRLRGALFAITALIIPNIATAGTPAIVQCDFGSGAAASNLTLLLPGGLKKGPGQDVKISAVPGNGAERPALATLVPKEKSEIGQAYVRVLFKVTEDAGFVTYVARNGDGSTFAIGTSDGSTGKRYLGSCDAPKSLFNLWR